MIEGLALTQFHGDKTPVASALDEELTAEDYVVAHFGGAFSYQHRWLDLGMLLAYIAIIRVAALIALLRIRNVHR